MLNSSSRRRTPAPSGGPLVTKQSHKAECDINNILSQFKKTGVINHISQLKPEYSELPDNIDYQSALNIQIQADEAFLQLPSVVRRYFNNDPAMLLAALNDPDQHDKLVEYGILNPKPAPQPAGNPDNIPATLATEPKLP